MSRRSPPARTGPIIIAKDSLDKGKRVAPALARTRADKRGVFGERGNARMPRRPPR